MRRISSPYILPGGGPWKIDESCLSEQHNTVYAARGYYYVNNSTRRSGIKCTCPRSLVLIDRQRAQARSYYKKSTRVQPGWWTGPWLIRPDCPATGHNILARALRPVDGKACICPRANALKHAHALAESERLRIKRAARAKAKVEKRPEAGTGPEAINIRSLQPSEIRHYARPDMSKGRCVTEPGALRIFDRAMEAVAHTISAVQARNAARGICHGCLLRVECLGWALQEEQPAGSWGGVLGGMDPWERAKEKERRGRGDNRDGAVHAEATPVRSNARSGERDSRADEEDGGSGVPEDPRPGSEVLPGRALPHRRTLRAVA